MATRVSITPVIYEQFRKKNGMYPVKIRVSFDRKSKFISTNILAERSQLGRNLIPRDRTLSEKIDSIVDRMTEAVNSIDAFWLDGRTVDEVVAKIQSIIKKEDYVFRLDFFEYGRKIADEKPKNSRTNYMCALHSFQEYLKMGRMDITMLSSSMMRGYEQFLRRKHGDGARALSLYTSAIAYIHKRAQMEYNNYETDEIYILNPFQYYKCPAHSTSVHRDTSIEVIQRIIDMRKSLVGRERVAADVFLLSFGLMGMNSPDLYGCDAPQDGVITYQRTKTRARRADRAEMRVRIENEIKELYGEYHDSTGVRAFGFHLRYSEYQNLTKAANLGLREISKTLELKTPLTLYAARHSWASIAYSIGVNKAVINDCLCHVDRDMKVTDIYVKKDWSILWKANKKVLSLFKW